MDVKLQTKKSLKSENNTSLLITKSVYEIVRSLLKRFKFACAAQFIYKSIMCTYSTYAEYINTIFLSHSEGHMFDSWPCPFR